MITPITKKMMIQYRHDGLTPQDVESRTGVSQSTVRNIEDKTGIKLNRVKRRPKKSWENSKAFAHRKKMVESCKIIFGKWVSNSPELRYDHGVS